MTSQCQRFYRLTNEEWVQAVHELKPSERDVLYYIRTLAPFSDSQVDIGVRETARILKMNPSTVSRALKVLDEKKYIDMELDRVKVTILPRGHAELEVLPTDNSVASTQHPVASTQHTRSPGNTLLLPRNTDIYIDRVRDQTITDLIQTNQTLCSPPKQGEREREEKNKTNSNSSLAELTQENNPTQTISNPGGDLNSGAAVIKKNFDSLEIKGRRLLPHKGTYSSISRDPWMQGSNPISVFKTWLCKRNQANPGKDAKSLSDASSEIRNDYVRARDLWEEFLEEWKETLIKWRDRVVSGQRLSAPELERLAEIQASAAWEGIAKHVGEAGIEQLNSSQERTNSTQLVERQAPKLGTEFNQDFLHQFERMKQNLKSSIAGKRLAAKKWLEYTSGRVVGVYDDNGKLIDLELEF